MRRCPTESMRANTACAASTVASSTCAMRVSAARHAASRVSRTTTCRLIPKLTVRA